MSTAKTVSKKKGGEKQRFGWVQLTPKSARGSLLTLPFLRRARSKRIHMIHVTYEDSFVSQTSSNKVNNRSVSLNSYQVRYTFFQHSRKLEKILTGFETLVLRSEFLGRSFEVKKSTFPDRKKVEKLPNFVQDKIFPFLQIKGASLLCNE